MTGSIPRVTVDAAVFGGVYVTSYVATTPFRSLQIRRNLHPDTKVVDAARQAWRTGGIRKLYAGVGITLKRHLIKRGVMQPVLTIYAPEVVKKVLPKSVSQKHPLAITLSAASISAAADALLVGPLDRAYFDAVEKGQKLPLLRAYREFAKSRPALYFARQMASWTTYLCIYYNFIPWAESKLGNGVVADITGGVVSAVINRSAVSIVDTVRYRALKNHQSTKALTIAREVYKAHGARAFFRGLGPGLVQYALVASIQFIAFRCFLKGKR